MDITDIISRLEIITEGIEYEEINVSEVQDLINTLISDIEASSNFDADFGEMHFDDLA